MRSPRFRSLEDPETLRLLVRNLPAGVYVCSEEGAILDANRGMLALLGVSSVEELRKLPPQELQLGGLGLRERQLERLEETGAVTEAERRLRRADGQVRTVLDTCYAVRDAESGTMLYHGIVVDITERKMFEQQLKEMTSRDPLTGCFNRRYLSDVEPRLIAERAEWGTIVVDIDHFKRYNDERGHQAGDEALVQVAHYLMRETRAHDAVVRLGGDEFLVLLVGEQAGSTAAIAARLREPEQAPSPVPLSLGWAVRRGDERLERTIQRADQRLYEVRAQERTERRAGDALPSLLPPSS